MPILIVVILTGLSPSELFKLSCVILCGKSGSLAFGVSLISIASRS